jgi:hypothetical protein
VGAKFQLWQSKLTFSSPAAARRLAQSEELFERYVSELRRLFDEHKALLPPEVAERGLVVLRRAAKSTQPDMDVNDTMASASGALRSKI